MSSENLKCGCGCERDVTMLRKEYPMRATIVKANPYGLPVGKEFPFARMKEGNASPFLVLVRGHWPAYFHGREYQLKTDEVQLTQVEAT